MKKKESLIMLPALLLAVFTISCSKKDIEVFSYGVKRGPAQLGSSDSGSYLTYRNQSFKEAGLYQQVKDMEGIQKDFLFMKSQESDLKSLSEEYPLLDAEKLRKLQEIVNNPTVGMPQK